MQKRFRYIFDPVCLAAVATYLAWRFLVRPTAVGHHLFLAGYVNDFLCVPIFLPPTLLLNRAYGLRRHDGPPTPFEILFHWALWSIIFEGIAPLMTSVYRTTADPLDVAAYLLGGLAAGLPWRSFAIGPRLRVGPLSRVERASRFTAAGTISSPA